MRHLDTPERRLAKERIANASHAAVHKDPALGSVGTSGAIAYALLDVASAIREHGGNRERMTRLLAISDSIVEAVLEGHSKEKVERLALDWTIEREGIDIDQNYGYQRPPGM